MPRCASRRCERIGRNSCVECQLKFCRYVLTLNTLRMSFGLLWLSGLLQLSPRCWCVKKSSYSVVPLKRDMPAKLHPHIGTFSSQQMQNTRHWCGFGAVDTIPHKKTKEPGLNHLPALPAGYSVHIMQGFELTVFSYLHLSLFRM